jgi:dTDP-4-dehydrorhamnose 3,5-epimerase-like enzyme
MSSINEIIPINLPSVHDSRGILTSIESQIDLPFKIQRIFYMHHISLDRGGHAHIDTDQVVIPISGNFMIELYDGKNKAAFKMEDATKGLYIPRMIFIRLYSFSEGAVCLVLANTHYDITRSIRTIEEYNEAIKKQL